MSFRCHSMTSAARGAVHMLAAALCAALVACGGGGSAPLPSVGQATIDAAGGTVEGPDGVQLVVPEAALASATTLRIARDATGAPELGGAKAISPVYAVTPHGTAFAESARISIPFSPEDVAPGTQPVILKSQPGGNWQVLPSQTSGNRVSAADTDSLSFYAVGTCFITRARPAVLLPRRPRPDARAARRQRRGGARAPAIGRHAIACRDHLGTADVAL
jgi:ZU5 domain